jgi:beta-D-xylosidase 4|eukprot:COSAG02_NODE_74_length_41878_cov_9.737954_28_plen_395_part_00
MYSGAVAGVTNPEPKAHPWAQDSELQLGPDDVNRVADRGIGSAGGHGYSIPNGSSLASAGLDSNCNLGGGSIDSRTGPEGDAARAQALEHLFTVQMRLGLFDPLEGNRFAALDGENVATENNQQLALDAARQGIVLLQNLHSTLPLEPGLGQLALLGPCLEVRAGGYSKSGTGGAYTGSAVSAIANYSGSQPVIVVGCADPKFVMGKRKSSAIDCAEDSEGFAAAVQAATTAASTIVSIGIDGSFEGENGDYRAFAGIGLPGAQLKLVQSVAAASPSPIIVTVSGSSVDLSPIKAHPNVGAIVWIGYGGEAAGQALADVLFGVHNPDGKLTTTFYPTTYPDQWVQGTDPYTGGVSSPRNASYFDSHMRPNKTTGNPGRTHRFCTSVAFLKISSL